MRDGYFLINFKYVSNEILIACIIIPDNTIPKEWFYTSADHIAKSFCAISNDSVYDEYGRHYFFVHLECMGQHS